MDIRKEIKSIIKKITPCIEKREIIFGEPSELHNLV